MQTMQQETSHTSIHSRPELMCGPNTIHKQRTLIVVMAARQGCGAELLNQKKKLIYPDRSNLVEAAVHQVMLEGNRIEGVSTKVLVDGNI